MPGFTQNPFEQDRAKQDDARRERQDAEYRADLLDLKRQLAGSRRRRENIAIGIAIGLLGCLSFGCWLLYEVSRTKGWLP